MYLLLTNPILKYLFEKGQKKEFLLKTDLNNLIISLNKYIKNKYFITGYLSVICLRIDFILKNDD